MFRVVLRRRGLKMEFILLQTNVKWISNRHQHMGSPILHMVMTPCVAVFLAGCLDYIQHKTRCLGPLANEELHYLQHLPKCLLCQSSLYYPTLSLWLKLGYRFLVTFPSQVPFPNYQPAYRSLHSSHAKIQRPSPIPVVPRLREVWFCRLNFGIPSPVWKGKGNYCRKIAGAYMDCGQIIATGANEFIIIHCRLLTQF
jgi:hypothetical protein